MNEDDCLRFDKAAFDLAHERMKSAPIELSEPDLDQLGIVSKTLEADAREAKRLAQIALVQPAPLVTKGAEPVRTTSAPPETVDEFIKRYGTTPVTWKGLMKSTEPFLEAVKVLTDRMRKLEQRNTELSLRVLELEAKDAAREAVTP